MKFIIGIIIVLAGFLLIWKNEAIVGFTGLNAWAERNLGTEGGTRTLYKFIGLVIIFIGFLVMAGLMEGFLQWMLTPILRPMMGL